MECGIVLENFSDVKQGDIIEVYETRQVERELSSSSARRWPSSASSTLDLHFPDTGDLKGKRKQLKSLKEQLRRRFGAAVAETDHHDLWQRSTLSVALVGASAARWRRAPTP